MNGNKKYDNEELKTSDLKAFLEYADAFIRIVQPKVKEALEELDAKAVKLQKTTGLVEANIAKAESGYKNLVNFETKARELEAKTSQFEIKTNQLDANLSKMMNAYKSLLDIQAAAQAKEVEHRTGYGQQLSQRTTDAALINAQNKAQGARLSQEEKALKDKIGEIKDLVSKYAENAKQDEKRNNEHFKKLLRALDIEMDMSAASETQQTGGSPADNKAKTNKLRNLWNDWRKKPNFFWPAFSLVIAVIVALMAFTANSLYKKFNGQEDAGAKDNVSAAQKVQTEQDEEKAKTEEKTKEKDKKVAEIAESYKNFKSEIEKSISGAVVNQSIEGNKFAIITKLPKEFSAAENPYYFESKYTKSIKEALKNLKDYFAADKLENRFKGELAVIIEYPAAGYEKCGKGTGINQELCKKKDKIKADEVGGYKCNLDGAGVLIDFSQEQPVWPDIAASKLNNIDAKEKTGEILGCMRAASLAKELKLTIDKTKLTGKKCSSQLCDQQSDNIIIRLEAASIDAEALEALKKAVQQHN